MALGSNTSVRWRTSKLRSFSASVIRAVVNAAYDISRHQADGDSLFEIRQMIAGFREYQSDAEESDGDSSDDEQRERVVMAPRCRKHPEGGPLVGVCPHCLTACLSKLAAAEDPAESCAGESASGASSPMASGRSMCQAKREEAAENRGEQGVLAAMVKVTPSSSKPLKASAPLAALKEGIVTKSSSAAASGKTSQTEGSCPRKPEARDEGRVESGGGASDTADAERTAFKADGGRRISTAQVVHQYCARSDLKASVSGHFQKSKSGRARTTNGVGAEGADREIDQARPSRRSNADGNPSLLSIMLRDRRRGGKDSSSEHKAGARSEQQVGDGKRVEITGVPAIQPSSSAVSWVSRIRSRRPADSQSVAKKLTVSALVHPDGVTV